MKILVTTVALLIAGSCPLVFAGSSGPAPTRPLACEKVDVGTACYILQRDEPSPIVDKQVLTYVDLKDARCPLDVDCVWAGYVEASFELQGADGSFQAFRLLIDPRYQNTNVFRDEGSGLTVILDAVQAQVVGPVPPGRDLVKVTVGYDLQRVEPNIGTDL